MAIFVAGEGIESEPYRLYNLDVFEYEHDSPFGLYGSIPYVVAHRAGATVGAFWCAAASTCDTYRPWFLPDERETRCCRVWAEEKH